MRRVVITGAGSVNALAHDVAGTWAAMAEGRSGIALLDLPELDRLQIKIGAQVKNWQPEARFSPRELSLYDPFTQFGVTAAAEAIAMAGDVPQTAGVIIGSAAGGLTTWEESYRAVYAEGKNRVPPLTVPRLMGNAAASHIAMRHGLEGPSFALSSACSSANHAIGLAFRMVREGTAPVMVAGGAEAMLSFGGLKAWEGLRVMSPDGCRPFSIRRNGMVMGEGAAVFVLEDRARALARGAEILAEVAGFGMSSDAADIVVPQAEGAAAAMRAALADGGLRAEEIGYINAHGTGTQVNDRTEIAAIHQAFGAAAARVMISSTKPLHGHAIGATGAIEALAVILALREGVIAPTLHLDEVDPACALDHVANEKRHARVSAALSNSFAFGGLNAVLAFRAP